MDPASSERNLTPTSIPPGWLSLALGLLGVSLSLQMLQGLAIWHSRGSTVTFTVADALPMLPESSTARLLRVNWPVEPGVQVKLQFSRPVAVCQGPPLIETSTAPTLPPPASVAVPWTVTLPACTDAPLVGEVIWEVGSVVSVEAVAWTRPDCRLPGWTPMSANRLTVACCILSS